MHIDNVHKLLERFHLIGSKRLQIERLTDASAFVVFDNSNWHTYIIQSEHLEETMRLNKLEQDINSFIQLSHDEQELTLFSTGLVKSGQKPT